MGKVPPIAVWAVIDPKKDTLLSPPISGGLGPSFRIAALAAAGFLLRVHSWVLEAISKPHETH